LEASTDANPNRGNNRLNLRRYWVTPNVRRRFHGHTALRGYTEWAARQLFLEKETGTVALGKWADLAVWDRNPYAASTAELKEMKCVMTLYRGAVVFEHR
jgi:predicted amidohydrolase YtcJ